MIRLALLTLLTACAHVPPRPVTPAERSPADVELVASRIGAPLVLTSIGLSLAADRSERPDLCRSASLHRDVSGAIGVSLLRLDLDRPTRIAYTVDLTACGPVDPLTVHAEAVQAIELVSAVLSMELRRSDLPCSTRAVLSWLVDDLGETAIAVAAVASEGVLVVQIPESSIELGGCAQ